MSNDLKKFIRNIPDFPQTGILFRDITPLLADGKALKRAVLAMADVFGQHKIDLVASPEARGFIFGTAIACELGAGFVPVRKPGKLPSKTIECEYDLEYGSNKLAVHDDAIQKGQRVLMVDDLLATGGTAEASCKLIEKSGGSIVGCSFLIELKDLKGRNRLSDYKVHAVIEY